MPDKIEFDLALMVKNRTVRLFIGVILSASALVASETTSHAASDITDACAIFQERPDWYDATKEVSEKWHVSVPAILAIIHRESRFNATASAKTSTAYGFAQVIDGTWKRYKKEMKSPTAKRSNFADSADFIGWYMAMTNDRLDIPLYDVKGHYLAYHEGHAGYKSNRWTQKPKLVRISNKVTEITAKYAKQLRDCGLLNSASTPVELLATINPIKKPFALESVPAVLPRSKPVSRQIASISPITKFGFKTVRR